MGWRLITRQPFKIENSMGAVLREEDDAIAKVYLSNDDFDDDITEHILNLNKVGARLKKNANFHLYFEDEEIQVLQSFFDEYEKNSLVLTLIEYLSEKGIGCGID